MNFFKQLGNFLMAGAHAHARWETQVSETIWTDRKRLLILLLFSVPAADWASPGRAAIRKP